MNRFNRNSSIPTNSSSLYQTICFLYEMTIEPFVEAVIGPTTPRYIKTRPPESGDPPGTIYRYGLRDFVRD